jgi:hypothetical protein
MARYARMNPDLTLASFINLDDPSVISTTKKLSDGGLMVRPVEEGERPTVRAELQSVIEVVEIEPGRVVISYEAADRSREHCVAMVKLEARQRILARYPEWKQANMTARGIELQDIWRRNGEWTVEEQAEATALMDAWAWIKSVREASDAIEALEKVPTDYNADERWP